MLLGIVEDLMEEACCRVTVEYLRWNLLPCEAPGIIAPAELHATTFKTKHTHLLHNNQQLYILLYTCNVA